MLSTGVNNAINNITPRYEAAKLKSADAGIQEPVDTVSFSGKKGVTVLAVDLGQLLEKAEISPNGSLVERKWDSLRQRMERTFKRIVTTNPDGSTVITIPNVNKNKL